MNIVRQATTLPMTLLVGPTETIHINCPPVYSCYRYDSVCRDDFRREWEMSRA